VEGNTGATMHRNAPVRCQGAGRSLNISFNTGMELYRGVASGVHRNFNHNQVVSNLGTGNS
jgi:hypothetical protein